MDSINTFKKKQNINNNNNNNNNPVALKYRDDIRQVIGKSWADEALLTI